MSPQISPELTEEDRVTLVQQELTRMKCAPGPIDGAMGNKTKRAFARFSFASGYGFNEDAILLDLAITAMRATDDPVCAASWLAVNKRKALTGNWTGSATCRSNGGRVRMTAKMNLELSGTNRLVGTFTNRWKDARGRAFKVSGTTRCN